MVKELEKLQNVYSKVYIICAGGTINMSGITQCIPGLGVEDIAKSISKSLSNHKINYEIVNIFDRAPDSSNIGEKEWGILINKIKDILNEKEEARIILLNHGLKVEKGGIVIAHGTDTLDITSLVISLELSSLFQNKNSVPIVFTASHSTIDNPKSDAKSNLRKAIYVAKERFNRTYNLLPGVYVLIGQDIHLASRITKVYTVPNSDKKYFFSFPSPIGMITGENYKFTVDYNYIKDLISTTNNIEQKEIKYDWGIVEHIHVDSNTPVKAFELLYKRFSYYKSKYGDLRRYGVILQGDFKKNINWCKIIHYISLLTKDNIIVMFGSNNSYTKFIQEHESIPVGLIPKSMSHIKSKIKLGWLLKTNKENGEIIKLMNKNFAGEIFSASSLPEWINYESIKPSYNNSTSIFIYPDIDEKVLEDSINMLDSKHKKIYIYGFGDGHLPTSNLSIKDIVNEFLQKKLTIRNYCVISDDIFQIEKELEEIIVKNEEIIKSYFSQIDFEIKIEALKRVLKENILQQKKEKNRKYYEKTIINLLKRIDRNDIIIDKNRVTEKMVSEMRFKFDNSGIDNDIKKTTTYLDSYDKQLDFLLLKLIYVLSWRLMKEAIMFSDKKLEIIGRAIDNDALIHMKTTAVKSNTDSMRYEIGNKMYIIGVDSDVVKGIKTDVIIKK